jgi:hypothetical protein
MHTVKEADMLAAKIDLLHKRFDERAADINTGTVRALDSQMACEVYGNVGHSGNNYPETHEGLGEVESSPGGLEEAGPAPERSGEAERVTPLVLSMH